MMNSMIIKRGLKNVDTFKTLSKRLVPKAEIVPKKKNALRISSSVKLIPNDTNFQIVVDEPVNLAKQSVTSPILLKIHEEENINEQQAETFLEIALEKSESDQNEEIDWNQAMGFVKAAEKHYPVPQKDLGEIMNKPGVRPTFNFASMVNDSPDLQRLVDLGTKISKWEEKGFMDMALSLDFVTDVAPRIHFLIDNGIAPHQLGHIFSENPNLFNQDMDHLQTRIDYLANMNFSKDQIKQILLLSDSKWLNFEIIDIDARLGFMLKLFGLNNDQVRIISSTCPQLVLWKGTPTQLENNHMALSGFMDFSNEDLKKIIINCPDLFMQEDTEFIQDRFDILYHDMGYDRHIIVHSAPSLNGDLLTMKTRLKLLQKLGKAQADPTKPNYVNPKAFALYSDEEFCQKVARIPVELYNKFMQIM